MDLRIFPQLIDGEEPALDDVYRLTLDGFDIDHIISHAESYTAAHRSAAILIEIRSSGTPRQRFEYYKAHPEKLPRGVILRTRPDIGPRPDKEYPR